MATLNISEAARATGMHRVTLQKHIKNGKLSSTKDANGKPRIDVAELMRVYGPLQSDGSTSGSTIQQQAAAELVVAAASIEALEKQLAAAQERERAAEKREEWLQAELTAAKEHNRELERRMLPPGEPGEGEPKKAFWKRVFG